MNDREHRKCRRCGWPESQPYETVSRHVTSTAVIVYTRCVCGLLQVRSYPFGPARPVGGRRADMIARGDCPAGSAATIPIRPH